ncbi:Rpr2-domain-containing protein [Phellopilus nigrolimitatus]|nr:Rpr2-domain-containing protein [Phellopilus nigrolimitatus]
MAKKNKDDAPNPNSIPNRDIIQRLNFLYQASTYLNGLGASQPQAGPSNAPPEAAKNDKGAKQEGSEKLQENADDGTQKGIKSSDTRKRPGKRKATAHDLARSYVKSMKIIGQKTNVKMDPSVKRTLCKGCNTVLMPGVTAKVRVKPLPSHGHAVNYTCINCSTSRRIPAPPTTEQPFRSSPAQLRKEGAKALVVMDVDPVRKEADVLPDAVRADEAPMETKPSSQIRREKTIKPRPLPFFAREGHILFVGNDRVGDTHETGAK